MPCFKTICFNKRFISVPAAAAIMLVVLCGFVSTAYAVDDKAAPDFVDYSASDDSEAGWASSVTNKLKQWHVEVGAGVRVAPKFEGSNDLELSPVPLLSAEIDDRVKVDPSGVMVKAYEFDNFRLSARLGYDLGRDDDDAHHLKGLGDVGAGVILGANATYELGPVELTAALDRTIGGSNGLVGTLEAKYSRRFGRFTLSAGPSVTWADGNYMGSYFSVNDSHAAKSGLSRYDADAGFKRVDFEASLSYAVTDNWIIQSRADLGYLLPAASDSPIVQQKFQPSVVLGLAYKF